MFFSSSFSRFALLLVRILLMVHLCISIPIPCEMKKRCQYNVFYLCIVVYIKRKFAQETDILTAVNESHKIIISILCMKQWTAQHSKSNIISMYILILRNNFQLFFLRFFLFCRDIHLVIISYIIIYIYLDSSTPRTHIGRGVARN